MNKRIKKNSKISKSIQPHNSNRKTWTESEDQKLENAIKCYGTCWRQVALQVGGRNPSQCAQRWKRIKPKCLSRNQKWTQEEDEKLISLNQELQSQWNQIASHFENRNARQVRERYVNYLDPSLIKDKWSQQEDELIWKLYKENVSNWQIGILNCLKIQQNQIKNRFYSFVCKTYGNMINSYYIVPQNVSCSHSIDIQTEIDKKQNTQIAQQNRNNELSDFQINSFSEDVFHVSQTNSNLIISNFEPNISSINNDNQDLQDSNKKESELDKYFQLNYYFHCGFDSYDEFEQKQ